MEAWSSLSSSSAKLVQMDFSPRPGCLDLHLTWPHQSVSSWLQEEETDHLHALRLWISSPHLLSPLQWKLPDLLSLEKIPAGTQSAFPHSPRDQYGETVYFFSACNSFKNVFSFLFWWIWHLLSELRTFLQSQTSALFDRSIEVPLLPAGLL